MKRFVVELANHALKPYEAEPERHEATWSRIAAAVRYCEKGMISEIEAAREIVHAVDLEEGRI